MSAVLLWSARSARNRKPHCYRTWAPNWLDEPTAWGHPQCRSEARSRRFVARTPGSPDEQERVGRAPGRRSLGVGRPRELAVLSGRRRSADAAVLPAYRGLRTGPCGRAQRRTPEARGVATERRRPRERRPPPSNVPHTNERQLDGECLGRWCGASTFTLLSPAHRTRFADAHVL